MEITEVQKDSCVINTQPTAAEAHRVQGTAGRRAA